MAKKPDGYMVFESCDDYEQALGLEIGDKIPFSAGLLTWQSADAPAVVFETRAQARTAIDRTEHFRRALLCSHIPDSHIAIAMPKAKFCRIVPVFSAESAPTELRGDRDV